MPVYGVVLTLDDDPQVRRRLMASLGAEPWLMLGVRQGSRLPVAMEADSVEEGERQWAQLESSPGVTFMELVFVDFSDVDEVDRHILRRKKRHMWEVER